MTAVDVRPTRRVAEEELFHADAAYRAAKDALTNPDLTPHTRKGLEESASYYAQRASYWRGELARLNRERKH